MKDGPPNSLISIRIRIVRPYDIYVYTGALSESKQTHLNNPITQSWGIPVHLTSYTKKCIHKTYPIATPMAGNTPSYGDCVGSLRTSLSFLESSVSTLGAGVEDFPRLINVLKTVRVGHISPHLISSIHCLHPQASISNCHQTELPSNSDPAL